MNRTCKQCGVAGEYVAEASGMKQKGFNGYTCYACYLEDQRAWRGTELGRLEANTASVNARARKHLKGATDRPKGGHVAPK